MLKHHGKRQREDIDTGFSFKERRSSTRIKKIRSEERLAPLFRDYLKSAAKRSNSSEVPVEEELLDTLFYSDSSRTMCLFRREIYAYDVIKYRTYNEGDFLSRFYTSYDDMRILRLDVYLDGSLIYRNKPNCQNSRNFIFQSISHFEKFKLCQKTFCDSEVFLGRDLYSGMNIRYGQRKQLLGSVVENESSISDVTKFWIDFATCQGFTKSGFCPGCKSLRKRLSEGNIVFDDDILEDEKPRKMKGRNRIIKLLDIALRKGKLYEGQRLYEMIAEQLFLASQEPNGIRSSSVPHTIQTVINAEISGTEGFRGKWVTNENGIKVYDGAFILPSLQCVNRHISYFRFSPGVSIVPLEMFGSIIEALPIKHMYITGKIDWMLPREGLDCDSINGVKHLVGLSDYGILQNQYLEIKAALEAHNNLLKFEEQQRGNDEDGDIETEVKKSKYYDRAIKAINYIEIKQNGPIRLAKKLAQFAITTQCRLKNGKSVLLNFPLFQLNEHSVSHNETRFMTNIFISSLNNYLLQKLKENHNFPKFRIDSFVADSESGLMSYWREDGEETGNENELPLKVLLPSLNVEKPLLHIRLFNDVEHLEKEVIGAFRTSTGYSSESKIIFFLCLVPGTSKKYKFYPFTYRCIENLYFYEKSHPFEMNLSRLSHNSVYPSQREKMKTRLASAIFHPDTLKSMEANLLEKFDDILEDEESVANSLGVTKNELIGTILVLKKFNETFDLKKYRATEEDILKAKKLYKYWETHLIEIRKLCKKNKSFSMKRNCIRTAIILKILRNLKNFISLHYEREKELIAHSVGSDNCCEAIFNKLRVVKGRNENPNFKEIKNRTGGMILKKHNNAFKRTMSYSNDETLSFNDILLNKNIIEKFKKLQKQENLQIKSKLQTLSSACIFELNEKRTKLDDLKKVELKGIRRSRFSYRIGYIINSTISQLNGKRKKKEAEKLLGLARKGISNRKIINPIKAFLEIMWKSDCYFRELVKILFTSKYLKLAHEICNLLIVREFSSDFGKIDQFKNLDKEEYSKYFKFLVEVFISCRFRDVLKNLTMNCDPGSRSFRNRY